MFACSNPARIAPWGELLSTAAQVRGAAGALMDGCTRDIKAIRAMNFPVFHGGIGPLDTKGRGRVMATRRAGALRRREGRARRSRLRRRRRRRRDAAAPWRSKCWRLAFDKIKGEKRTLDDLRAGEKLGDVFAKYGIF